MVVKPTVIVLEKNYPDYDALNAKDMLAVHYTNAEPHL